MNALGELLLSFHDSLYRYARALAHDPASAEELVQETYRRALEAKRYPDPLTCGNVRPWAFTILRHVWHNSLRDTRYEVEIGPIEYRIADPGSASGDALLRSEIVHAIDALPDPLREVIVLREVEGLSYAEIAGILKCPQGTVMSRLARARQLLRRLLIRFAPSSEEVRP